MEKKSKLFIKNAEKEKQKQEKKQFRSKIGEFLKKYYTYNQKDSKLSTEIKQELTKLGAFKPFYADNENDRAIFLINLWSSSNKEVKNIVWEEAQKHFPEKDNLDNF